MVEKRPLKYAETSYLGQPLTLYPRISQDAANQLLTEQTVRTSRKSDYYGIYENRLALMSKAYFWAEKYMQYFPDQMSVYYEDMDIIIYEIKQNMYALNNFAIDYGYNTITMEQWLLEHPEAFLSIRHSVCHEHQNRKKSLSDQLFKFFHFVRF